MEDFLPRTYLNVPFKDFKTAKELGARWDSRNKQWYYDEESNANNFTKWEQHLFNYKDLSDEQQFFIQKAEEGHNILVDACIGSGKTTSIQVLCTRLRKKQILYLTYNTLLKVDAKAKICNRNVQVTNYHGFAYSVLNKMHIQCGTDALIQTFNAIKPPVKHYDVLIIDEYQDIEQETANLLKHIKTQNPTMQIIAVGDMKQKIYDKTILDVEYFINQFLDDYLKINFTKCFRLNADFAGKLGRIWNKNINGVNDNCKVQLMDFKHAINFLLKQDPKDVLCLGSRNGQMCYALNTLEHLKPDKFKCELARNLRTFRFVR